MSNKYDLQIKTNYYKTVEQFQGNGLYGQYVDGCFSNGKDFLVYPFRAIFYLWVGNGDNLRLLKTVRVEGHEDISLYHRDDVTFFKYANQLLDWYKENCLECINPSDSETCSKCLNGEERF